MNNVNTREFRFPEIELEEVHLPGLAPGPSGNSWEPSRRMTASENSPGYGPAAGPAYSVEKLEFSVATISASSGCSVGEGQQTSP